jgi:TonB family protein
MPSPRTGGETFSTSAGHLSVHLDGERPAEVPFLFEQQSRRIGPSLFVALLYHLAALGFVALSIRYATPSTSAEALLPEQPNSQIVWISEPGPGGGGGGGGNQMKEPPKKAELPGKDKITVPVSKPPAMQPPKQIAKAEPNPLETLNIPAKSLADGIESLPGALEAPPGPPTASLGSGRGTGAGTGVGSGIGSGTGSGLGQGTGGGTGGGVYQIGSGVTSPVPVFQPRPQYTSDAMRARVQGTAMLSCVVRPDGSVSDVEVLRSLDRTFGLDEEAVKAARQWRFRPGTLRGEAVPVRVVIEMSFTLR